MVEILLKCALKFVTCQQPHHSTDLSYFPSYLLARLSSILADRFSSFIYLFVWTSPGFLLLAQLCLHRSNQLRLLSSSRPMWNSTFSNSLVSQVRRFLEHASTGPLVLVYVLSVRNYISVEPLPSIEQPHGQQMDLGANPTRPTQETCLSAINWAVPREIAHFLDERTNMFDIVHYKPQVTKYPRRG